MLSEAQNLYVLLLCDRSARNEFLTAPERLLAEYDCTEEEQTWLRALPIPSLERYAAGLLSKRWRAVRSACPQAATLWPALEQSYRSWLTENPAWHEETELSFGEAEALRALPALRLALQREEHAPPYAADALTLEVLRRCSQRDGKTRTLRSQWNLQEWWKLELPQKQKQAPPPQPTEVRLEQHRSRWRPWLRAGENS